MNPQNIFSDVVDDKSINKALKMWRVCSQDVTSFRPITACCYFETIRASNSSIGLLISSPYYLKVFWAVTSLYQVRALASRFLMRPGYRHWSEASLRIQYLLCNGHSHLYICPKSLFYFINNTGSWQITKKITLGTLCRQITNPQYINTW